MLVVAQVALSMLLITAATLLTVSAMRLQRINPGFNADNILMFSIDTSLNGYDAARSKAFFDAALDRLRALPGVESASLSSHRLVANSSRLTAARPAGAPAPSPGSADAQKFMETHRAYMLQVDEDFVKTMQMSLLRGRALARSDVEGAPRVAIVNAALARQLFGTEDVVGRRFLVGLSSNTEIEIVGVVANAVYTSIRRQNAPIVYQPFRQGPVRGGTFEIRTAGDPTAITASAREALRAIDPTLPIFNVRTLEEQILRSLRQERLFARLSLMLGGLALTLSAMGLYGLLAYAVVRRTPEIGVRIALGAERSAVRWMVLKQSLMLVALGLAIGIPAARSSTGVLASLLFGLEPHDPRVLAAAAAIMCAVAFGAAYIPARRASNIDPLIALRQE
jgi:predicted permease